MKISDINYSGMQSKVYIYEDMEEQLYLIALPEFNWSLEVETSLNEDDIKEELVIHLFTLLDESTAIEVAVNIVKRISEN
ncbi:MAG TPA: YueH family protein [Staphylococcus sp.]|nr:YueH family protein [Staphylococcus sp.]